MTIKEYRKKFGISQTKMAKMLGLTQSGYSKKENDPNSFKPSELKIIAKELDLTIEEIYLLFNIN